jgi:hypothetical protein
MKRKIYILLSIILGILLGTIAHALVEKLYITDMLSRGAVLVSSWSGNCFLPPGISTVFLLGGMIFGYVAGVRWWQIVYVEKRHWRMRRK